MEKSAKRPKSIEWLAASLFATTMQGMLSKNSDFQASSRGSKGDF
jgi:hypothetical protein